MGKCLIKLDLQGHRATDWPWIEISINDQQMFNGQIVGHCPLEFEVDVMPKNILTISHYNKNDDVILDSNGTILKDRYCMLNSLSINDLTFDLNFFSRYKQYYHTNDGEQLITNYFGKDGKFEFVFDWPLWKFWYNLQTKLIDSNPPVIV